MSALPNGKRWRAGVLGATGMVGQRLVKLLADHPWFTLTEVAASERSSAKTTPKPCAGISKDRCRKSLAASW